MGVTAFSPLGAQSYVSIGMATAEDSLLNHPTIRDAAWLHGRNAGADRSALGHSARDGDRPQDQRPDRLAENLALFDFELSAEEMNAISGLNRDRRFNDPGVFCEEAFHTFCPIYE